MKEKDKKEERSALLIRLSKNIHMEAKAQAAYRNQTLAEYVIDALLRQIYEDKKYQ